MNVQNEMTKLKQKPEQVEEISKLKNELATHFFRSDVTLRGWLDVNHQVSISILWLKYVYRARPLAAQGFVMVHFSHSNKGGNQFKGRITCCGNIPIQAAVKCKAVQYGACQVIQLRKTFYPNAKPTLLPIAFFKVVELLVSGKYGVQAWSTLQIFSFFLLFVWTDHVASIIYGSTNSTANSY